MGQVMLEKESNSATYYPWDLGNDFTSLTFRLLIYDLGFISEASLWGRRSLMPGTEEMLEKCQWLIHSFQKTSSGAISSQASSLQPGLPSCMASSVPSLPLPQGLCTQCPFCLEHTFRLYPHGAWEMLKTMAELL